ncbi:hypothetical protein JOE30_002098 [Rhodococcus sp. PvP016]|uniref:Uncharacterized protein n=1 Tax=Rhodococcoides corynebacterioides TaxID=53972 RepID=A0ABS2KPU1_9NOCA|nr:MULTISPECIES: hypothetical protein [Rhodococcus]MBM7413838.1 hypothetical protein [Rhodococcus corynebacterioides]MBP1116301.1 hypothetical protein [Rhodococcus sp. PvP016]
MRPRSAGRREPLCEPEGEGAAGRITHDRGVVDPVLGHHPLVDRPQEGVGVVHGVIRSQAVVRYRDGEPRLGELIDERPVLSGDLADERSAVEIQDAADAGSSRGRTTSTGRPATSNRSMSCRPAMRVGGVGEFFGRRIRRSARASDAIVRFAVARTYTATARICHVAMKKSPGR